MLLIKMRIGNSINYLNIKPKLSKDFILRYAKPDPPLIYNKKEHKLIVAKNYKVLDILRSCTGENTIKEISGICNVGGDKVYSLLKKIENIGGLTFE